MALRNSLSNLAFACASILKTRLEIFALEAQNQKHEILSVVGLVLGGVLLLGLGLLVLTLTLALLFWAGPYRYAVLFALALFYIVCGGLLLWRVRRKLLTASMPFSATLEELNNDVAMLNSLRGKPEHEKAN